MENQPFVAYGKMQIFSGGIFNIDYKSSWVLPITV